MILNEAKVVFIRPPCVGGTIIIDNLEKNHQTDLNSSMYSPYSKYIRPHVRVTNYFLHKGSILPPHVCRSDLDYLFTGNSKDFCYFTMVRNPWCQSLSFAKYIINACQLDVKFTLDYKESINKIIKDVYLSNRYRRKIIDYQIHNHVVNRNGKMLDYDLILHFENYISDLKKLSFLSNLKFKKI